MATITVEFEVPDDILTGLATGKYERVGGVIRHTQSKQVFAWLREGGNLSRSSSTGLTLLPTLLRATGMNARTVAVVAGAVTIAGPMLDIVITAYTIHHLTQRIAALEKKIGEIYDRVDHNFAKLHAASLQTALQTANELLETEDFVSMREKANGVIARLVNAEKLLLMDLDNALSGNKRRKAEVLISTLTSINLLAARCSLAVGEEKIAISRFDENLVTLRPRVDQLVYGLVGKQPALYFHRSVSDDYLDRYIHIQAWLCGDEDVWERVIKKARKRFWNEKSINRLFREARRFLYTWPELRKKPFYKKALPRAERLIESFQRFESFAIEIKSQERPDRDLAAVSEEAAKRLADHDDYVLVVDEEALDRIRRLSAEKPMG